MEPLLLLQYAFEIFAMNLTPSDHPGIKSLEYKPLNFLKRLFDFTGNMC